MDNKVVIITGATKGMGFASSQRLLELGAKVVMNRSDSQRAQAASNELKAYSKQLLLVQADVTKEADRQKIIDETLTKFERIDVLVNNAGVATKQSFLKLDEEEFDSIIAVNLKGPILLAKLVAQQMIKQGDGGSIINFSSISGHRATGGISYEAAKAGLIMATKSMATVLGKYNIRVNSISPGIYKTEMNRFHWENNSKLFQDMVAITALNRAAEAKEIAGTVVYLASDQSSYTTGTDIITDGGFLAHFPGRGK